MKRYKKLYFSILFCAMVFTMFVGSSNSFLLAEEPAPQALEVVITTDTPSQDIEGTNFSEIPRKNVNSFNLNLSDIPPMTATNFSFSVLYKQVYYTEGMDPIAGTEPLELLEKNVTSLTYDLTSYGNETEIDYPKDWGLYTFRFTYTLPNEQVVQIDSKTYFVSPTPITTKPQISHKEIVNTQSNLAGYLFTIDNEEFKYCDQSLITWYGEAEIDGNHWTLDDAGSIKRTGTTFEFMPTLEATYTIYALATSKTGQGFESNKIEVETFMNSTSVITIIIIVVSIIAACALILALSIWWKVKHEKIW